MRRSQPKRDWSDARAKCDEEGGCRVCGKWPVEAAHIVGRKRDFYSLADVSDEMFPGGCKIAQSTLTVEPVRIIPLCQEDHYLLDIGDLDILAHLDIAEQLQAVADCGGIEQARIRLAPSQYGRSTGGARAA